LNLQQKEYISFYQNLGKLFYAIAASDKQVRDEEFKTLKNIIYGEWELDKSFDGNFKDSAIHIILDTFKWLHNDNEYNAQTCYDSFINFKNTHTHIFNKKVNSLILKTASKIAASYSSINKSELMMLAKLNIELNKTL